MRAIKVNHGALVWFALGKQLPWEKMSVDQVIFIAVKPK